MSRQFGGNGHPTRGEMAAQARRERARAHLERVRGGHPSQRPRPLAVSLVLAASALAGLLLANPLLSWASRDAATEPQVHGIAVRGAQNLSPEDVARASGIAPGAGLDRVSCEEVMERLAQHAWIREARCLVLATGRVLVDVVEREPVAVLEGEPRRVVDREGAAFAPASPEHVHELTHLVAADRAAGSDPNARLAAAVRLAERLTDFGLERPLEVAIAAEGDPEGYRLRLPGLSAEFVLGWEDLEGRIGALAQLLAAGMAEVEGAERVDLRFADHVVLRGESPGRGASQAAAKRGGATPSNLRPAG